MRAAFKATGFVVTEEQIESYARLELAVQEEVVG